MQPGPKICLCFLAWVCVQGNSRCAPIQLGHGSWCEGKMKMWRLYLECPPVSSPCSVRVCQSFEADPPQPHCHSLCDQAGRVHPALRLQTTNGLVGWKTWELFKGNHSSPHAEICSADRKFPGVIQSSEWCLPGSVCSEMGQSSTHRVCHWEIFCVLYKHLTQGTLCSQQQLLGNAG